jgi:hypothetical protein
MVGSPTACSVQSVAGECFEFAKLLNTVVLTFVLTVVLTFVVLLESLTLFLDPPGWVYCILLSLV